jgi:hypothetical protein
VERDVTRELLGVLLRRVSGAADRVTVDVVVVVGGVTVPDDNRLLATQLVDERRRLRLELSEKNTVEHAHFASKSFAKRKK